QILHYADRLTRFGHSPGTLQQEGVILPPYRIRRILEHADVTPADLGPEHFERVGTREKGLTFIQPSNPHERLAEIVHSCAIPGLALVRIPEVWYGLRRPL